MFQNSSLIIISFLLVRAIFVWRCFSICVTMILEVIQGVFDWNRKIAFLYTFSGDNFWFSQSTYRICWGPYARWMRAECGDAASLSDADAQKYLSITEYTHIDGFENESSRASIAFLKVSPPLRLSITILRYSFAVHLSLWYLPSIYGGLEEVFISRAA